MKKLKVTSVLAVLLFLSVAGVEAQTVTPSKKYITKELNNVGNFSAVTVLGSTDVEYRQNSGSATKVSVYGSDNLVDLVEVSAVNGVLHVSLKKGVRINSGERRLKVIASSSALNRVDIKGSADVHLKGMIKGADLKLNISGSGDIEAENLQYTGISCSVQGSGDVELKGSTRQATLTVKGSGDIKADKLTADNVVANISGSGDITCYASGKLDAKVSGSGDIEYKGSPSVVNKEGRRGSISGR